ncbi:MAG: hypothetical protein CL911_05630 [Deltaproteobacteria bacterium]|nr:hypothetical protein [Deltaproteobacteria bacterium]
MKISLSLIVVIMVAGIAFAGGDDDPKGRGAGSEFLEAEIEAVLAEVRDRELGSFTVGEVEALMGEISIAQQKAAYIQKSAGASFMLPGVGQMKNEAVLNGALLLTADVLVSIGTVVGGYFLLPAELRFDQLDYFNAPMSTIKERWHAQSIAEMLPAVGVAAGGCLVHMVLRVFASKGAAELARERIAEGRVTFEPRLLPGPAGHKQ